MTDPDPRWGEVWWVSLDPTVGSEIAKKRPAVVVSNQEFGNLRTRIIVPLTSWQERFGRQRNRVLIQRTGGNGLAHNSAADVLQIRTASLLRFDTRLGRLTASEMQLITDAIHHATTAGTDP